MLKMYKALVLPHFHYCSSVWYFCGIRNSEKLEAVNKRILRFILNYYTSQYTTLLNKITVFSNTVRKGINIYTEKKIVYEQREAS